MLIHRDREIKAKRPDIVIRDHQEKRFVIDVLMTTGNTISLKETKKVLKYRDLEIEMI